MSDDAQIDDDKFELTSVYQEPWDADRRLSELSLSRDKLLDVAAIAMAERSNATRLHCANAAGTFAYHHGTFAMREKHAVDGWVVDRTDGVESMRHDQLKIKVAFTNVDIACDLVHMPKPRSEKGAGIERAAMGNLFGSALPHFAPRQKGGFSLYYLMVGADGRSELTQPIVRRGIFVAAVERIFLGAPGDDNDPLKKITPVDNGASNYEPIIARKTGT